MSEEESLELSDNDYIDEEENVNFNYAEEIISKKILTKFEFVSVVITRAEQISNGSKYFVSSPGIVKDAAIKIAIMEILENKCPLSVCREIFGKKEIIPVNDLEKLKKYLSIGDLIKPKNSDFDVKKFLEDLKNKK